MKRITLFLFLGLTIACKAQTDTGVQAEKYSISSMKAVVMKNAKRVFEFDNTDVCTWKFVPEHAKLIYTQTGQNGRVVLTHSWSVLEISKNQEVDSYLVEGEMKVSNYVTGETEKYKGKFKILFYHTKEMVSYEIGEGHFVLMTSLDEWNNVK